jgi:chemotaxis protein MotB
MAKDKCPDCPKCLPGWLVQFGDLMSLLLCFFILLLSMATMDKKKVEEYFEIMRRSMGFLEGATDTSDAVKEKLSEQHINASESGNQNDDGGGNENGEIIAELEDVAREYNYTTESENDDEITVNKKNNNEFSMEIPSSLVFASGDYELKNSQAKRFITKIARIVRTMSNGLDIEVVGYSSVSEIAPSNEIPRDDWDISALRSISMVKELIKNKIDPQRLKVSAFGSNRPKGSNRNENQRVELRFISSAINGETGLEDENFFDRIEK